MLNYGKIAWLNDNYYAIKRMGIGIRSNKKY